MADRINYRFPEMESAAVEVDNYASQYRAAADKLMGDVMGAIANWEGESKERFAYFLQGAVYSHIHESVPQLVEVIAIQIRESAKHMQTTDADVAAQIPQSLG